MARLRNTAFTDTFWNLIYITIFLICSLFQVLGGCVVGGGGSKDVEVQTARILKYPTQRARLHTLYRTSTPLDAAARKEAAATIAGQGAPPEVRQSLFETALMQATDRSAVTIVIQLNSL